MTDARRDDRDRDRERGGDRERERSRSRERRYRDDDRERRVSAQARCAIGYTVVLSTSFRGPIRSWAISLAHPLFPFYSFSPLLSFSLSSHERWIL